MLQLTLEHNKIEVFKMEFRQLEYFMTLSKELHFTRAAEKLHISQPTLSHQIKVLENEVGALLFDRIGKKISLTEAGKILYEQSVHIFSAIENTKLQINDLEVIQRGSLKIGALPGELTNLVSDSLLHYIKEYPLVQVSVLSSDDLHTLLKDNKIDYAFSFVQELALNADERFIEIPLYTEEFVFVTHKHHPLMAQSELSLHDVSESPLILFPNIHLCRKILDISVKQNRLSLNTIFETSSINTIFNFVKRNLGGTIVAKSLYELHQHEDICARPISNSNLNRETVLIYRKDKFMNMGVKSFIPILTHYLEQLHISLPDSSYEKLNELVHQ